MKAHIFFAQLWYKLGVENHETPNFKELWEAHKNVKLNVKLNPKIRIFKLKNPKIRIYKRKINKIVGGINLINWTITDVGQLQKNLENDVFKNSELKELSEKLISKLGNLINKYNKIL